jgi:hypothetical protein
MTMKIIRSLVLGTLMAFLSGCATYSLVPANQAVDVGNGVKVTSEISWSKQDSPTVSGTVWTADGVELDALMFFTGVPEGKPLIKPDAVRAKELRVYKADMIPDDVMELLSSNFRQIGFDQIKTANLRPAPFGAAQGFRFDMDFVTKDGLQMKGMALAAQRAKTLNLILYTAPTEYYYDRYAGTVDKIFAGIQAEK